MSENWITRSVNLSPQLQRGQVWCRECGATQKVGSAQAMTTGWPCCCGYTMTIDSPEEQFTLKRERVGAEVSE